jgi:hypothetical protein
MLSLHTVLQHFFPERFRYLGVSVTFFFTIQIQIQQAKKDGTGTRTDPYNDLTVGCSETGSRTR